MRVDDFDYELPEELIAQEPLADRSASRMLVVHRNEGRWEDRLFRELPQFIRPGDCMVFNNSRVFPSRLFGRRAPGAAPFGRGSVTQEHVTGECVTQARTTGERVSVTVKEAGGAAVEVFLLRKVGPHWEALVRPGRKMPAGQRVLFNGGLEATVISRGTHGQRRLAFGGVEDVEATIHRIGHVPLPPYIRREDRASDRERYQTVYAQTEGSVAAPTAGLHFTPETMQQCREAGAELAFVTLHVGLGTFAPIHAENVEDVRLHSERFSVPTDTVKALSRSQRVLAVGTTAVRTLETFARTGQTHGETDIFLSPGAEFRMVNAMLTNFHLPRSSLVMLVAAFAGVELIFEAYRHAVRERYRFFSYGDCMLLL